MAGKDRKAEDRLAADALAVEVITPERKAQFLLSNAVDHDDYVAACTEVRAVGLDPEQIRHYKPAGGLIR